MTRSRNMRATCLLIASIMLVGAEIHAGDESVKDLAAMQGDWAALSHVRNGAKTPDDEAQALFRTVKGNEYAVFRFKDEVGRGTFKLDATKKPKAIDFQPAQRPGQAGDPPKPLLGIYEFEGGRL